MTGRVPAGLVFVWLVAANVAVFGLAAYGAYTLAMELL